MQLHVEPQVDAVADALERLADYAFADGPGLATHGPMAAEALTRLGYAAEVPGWVEQYKVRHEMIPAPPRQEQLDPADAARWTPALGDPARLSDWEDLFAAQLQEQPWHDVLERWIPVLLAGYGGAFTHGLLRTAHAVRSLAGTSSPSGPLVGELASGLAYWAGTYKVLPGRPALQGSLSFEDALARLPRPAEEWNPMEAGMFLRLHELAAFPGAVEALGAPTSVDAALSELTAAMARMMVANPQAQAFGLVHALTPVAGARRLLAYAPAVSAEQLYAQLWHVNAAIAVGFVHQPNASKNVLPDDDAEQPDPAELVARAVEHKDPHVLKFTEAALGEHRLRPDPAYLRAAQHVFDVTPAW